MGTNNWMSFLEGLVFVPSLRIPLSCDSKVSGEYLYALYAYGYDKIPVIKVFITGILCPLVFEWRKIT